METYQRSFIELAFHYQALRFGEFKLKSGRLSPYFFNLGQLCSGAALASLGECYAMAIHQSNISFDLLFGPAYKGIPLVCASAISLHTRYKKDVPYCYNRKEAKDHGEKGLTVGAPLKGQVIVIDDVITAGTAMREAFELIMASGAKIAAVFVALDRQEKGEGQLSAVQEIQQQYGIPVQSIIRFDDVMEFVSQEKDFADYREPMMAYRKQYGIVS